MMLLHVVKRGAYINSQSTVIYLLRYYNGSLNG